MLSLIHISKGEETGKVVAGETKEVTYVYKEVTGDVVVHYVDKEGNTIAADKDDLKGCLLYTSVLAPLSLAHECRNLLHLRMD